MVVVIANTVIGTAQEIRARKVLAKISMLRTHTATVLRNGSNVKINRDDIVKDDILVLSKGMQIPVDCILIDKTCTLEVNESLLTGESENIHKIEYDVLYSGSIVIQGNAKVQAYKVGDETYINNLSSQAKEFRKTQSHLQRTINKLIKTLTYILVPIGILLFVSQIFWVNQDWKTALLGSVAGIIGMIPDGLVLLTSLALTAGVLSLLKLKVITRELSGIETLARVDTLCLDKTGTLTKGQISVEEVIYYSGKNLVDSAVAAIATGDTEQNFSTKALLNRFGENTDWKSIRQIPFSSELKYQGAEFEEYGLWKIGAPDVIVSEQDSDILENVDTYTEKGSRVLAVTHESETTALIILSDIIRNDAADTVTYFQEQDVKLKIISGDNPKTVENIASKVGIEGNVIDARQINDENNLSDLLENITIFGRVTPEQKKEFVESLQSNGHVVAMTGDGINDVLALKQADCGIAMSSVEAVEAVSQFILLESKFSCFPDIVNQGRRVINNINRLTSVFLIKTVYSIILSLIFALVRFKYPYIPRQISFIGFFAVGVPSFLIALEPNYSRVKGDFTKGILKNSIPSGIVIALTVIIFTFTGLLLDKIGINFDYSQTSTIVILIIGSIQIFTLYLICRPLTRWRRTVIIAMVVLFYVSFFIKPVSSFFALCKLTPHILGVSLIFTAISVLLLALLQKFTVFMGNILKKY
jgi:cation-transporting ATPase E